MIKYIESDALLNDKVFLKGGSANDPYVCGYLDALDAVERAVKEMPAANVVPWEWLERYTNNLYPGILVPEFIREAKMFYESSNKAMLGGVIDG